ncbi:hypothetical protein B0H14DRAFT_1054535 [Mycena olivaceomarginata]|nr:hypothetical protein B0H14DRAFT_1054535 [Mycena olivaceomarginata]
MLTVFLLFFFVFSLSHAFTLSLPDKLNSGTLVTVQWSRDNGDPTSFGLMQRSLLGNQPVLSVTPVQNAAGDRSGTADVVFSTSGQVLLAVIAQLSLSSGEKPNQLAAGKQLTVVPGSNLVDTTTTRTAVLPKPLSTTTTPTTDSDSPTQISSTTTALVSAPPPTSSTEHSTSSLSHSINLSPSPTQSSFSPSSSPASSSVQSSFSSSSSPASSSTPAPSKSSPSRRHAVVALALTLPILFLLLLLLFCVVRAQRASMRHRIDQFTTIWTNRLSTRETISSFGNLDVEAGSMVSEHPAPETRQVPFAVRREQKLRMLVDEVAVEEPPPVYVESPGSKK